MKILSSLLAVGIFWNVDAVDLHRFFWPGYQHHKPQEEIRVIEIVRWHQPICVKPGKGVSSCLDGLSKPGQHAKGLNEEKEEFSILSESRSSVPSNEEEVLSEFVASEMFASFPLQSSLGTDLSTDERMSESGKRTEALTTERERRDARHLVSHLDKTAKPKQIYVTKVLNAPFTATLVAQNCLPDIGIPLCENNEKDAAVEDSKSMADSKYSSSLSISVIGKDGERPTNVKFTGNSFSVKSVAGSAEQADVKNPDSDQASTSLIPDYPDTTTHVPASRRIAPSNLHDKSSSSSLEREPGIRSNVSSSNFEKRADNQFAPTELVLESSEGVVEESSATTKMPEISQIRNVPIERNGSIETSMTAN